MRVAVVGAGLAGLAAADAIVRDGAEAVVFEARDRVGGRVSTQTLPNGAVIERGAEFVLPGYTALREEAARFGLGFWDKGMRYGRRDPRGVTPPPGSIEAAVIEIEIALAAAGPDRSEESVAALLSRLEIDEDAREAILARAEVSAAAPAGLVPAAELRLLARVSEEPAPTIAGGNSRLAEALAAALPPGALALETPVGSLEIGADRVLVGTDRDARAFDACVIAVPVPLVEALAFEPGLPDDVAEALTSISFGHAAKLFVPLAEPAAPSATLAVPDRYWAWTATGEGNRRQPVLSAFAGSAPALTALGVAEGSERWLAKVDALRPDLRLEPSGAVLVDWDADPWARGAYSVAVPAEARERLSRPFGPGGRAVFAGEFLGGEMAGLMEGALRSGRLAAERLLAGVA